MTLIISGLSGAGKSTALHALEDVGCFCTDNLPLPLLEDWARQVERHGKPMAVCVDARSGRPEALLRDLRRIREQRDNWRLMFLEADDAALLRRYSTLRRRHPYAPDMDLPQAIAAEREALAGARALADIVIDTSAMNPYALAAAVEAYWRRREGPERVPELTVTLISFSYRRGLPPEADMVLDVRFLPNPHYEPDLAALTGRDAPVAGFLGGRAEVREAERRIRDWLRFIWEQMTRERKRYFTLAVGCSGGRHRSVYMVERMASWLRESGLGEPLVRHRELEAA